MAQEPKSTCLNLLPFGIPTLIIAEDPRLLATARAAYAHWLKAPVTSPALELRLETGSASSLGVCLDIRVEGSRLLLNGKGASGSADAVSGKAHAIVPASMVSDVPAFTDLTDTLLLFMLARRGRTPVHAAAFMLGDQAVVLAGRSGSGKSTLALAAAERGLAVMTDDMVFVQREPEFAVWGFPRPVHVFPDDAPPGEHSTRIRSDKLKLAVTISRAAVKAERSALILLERGTELALRRADREQAVEALMNLDSGFDLLERESHAALEALASHGAWRLTLSKDAGAAIDLLVSRFAEH